jgi:hypothetical protein
MPDPRVVTAATNQLNPISSTRCQASDSFPTAFPNRHGVDLSGVEIAATAFANLLHREILVGLPEWARTTLVLALGGAFALASCLGAVWRGLAATLALAPPLTAPWPSRASWAGSCGCRW